MGRTIHAFLFLICILLCIHLEGQRPTTDETQDDILTQSIIYKDFGTQRYLEEFIPSKTGSGSIFGYITEIKAREREVDSRITESDYEVSLKPITIHLVFHMLNSNDGKEVKTAIKNQLQALNRDFNAINPPRTHPNDPLGLYIKRAKSPKIRFEAARIEASSEHDNGIVSLRNSDKEWLQYDQMKERDLGGSPPIEPDRFVNIWVVDLPDHLQSYATSPFQPIDFSGIVIDGRFFGTKDKGDHGFIEGKTLTHLMGNYLGLKDLWNQYDTCADDGVQDTPIHNAPVRGCPEFRYITTCDEDNLVPVMSMNFMSSSDDACQFMFTQGQVHRMRSIIQEVRPALLDSKSLKD